MQKINTNMGAKLLDGATATGEGTPVEIESAAGLTTYQAFGTTTAGAGAAAIKVQVSNDGDNWLDAGTISLVLATTASSDGFSMSAKWTLVRGNVSSISGTGAAVSLVMGA